MTKNMIVVEVAVITSIMLLAFGYFRYQKYGDVFKAVTSLVSIDTATSVSIVLLSYFSLKFLFALGS